MTTTTSTILEAHTSCPCGASSDAFTVYSDGHGFCFSCDKHYKQEELGELDDTSDYVETVGSESGRSDLRYPLPDRFSAIIDRAISADGCRRFRLGLGERMGDVIHVYPYYRQGRHVANKLRTKDKRFFWDGDPEGVELFGQSVFPPGSAKAVTLVEGELDAVSAYELMGSRFPVVSVTSASNALRDCRVNYEYLDSFPEIVICFDKDDAKIQPNGDKRYPGQEAAKKVASLFKPGKVRIVTLQKFKDPNDYLKAGAAKEFTKEWWNAPVFMPDGLKLGRDMLEEILNRSTPESTPWPSDRMNTMTYGIRLSEVVLIKADTGVGKTQFLKEVEHYILMNPELKEKGYGIGLLHLEETNVDTALGIMSIHNDKPYHLPDTARTNEELKEAFDATINSDRFVVFDHFGSNSVDNILDRVRHMAALGCKYIFIDHLSIIVSDQSGDERKQLDEISTKLKMICMELELACVCVIHINRQGQVRSSAGPEKIANIMMSLEREKMDPDPWRRNVTKVFIEKNRFSGRTGPCEWLFYDEITGRQRSMTQEEIDVYESGSSIRDDQVPW